MRLELEAFGASLISRGRGQKIRESLLREIAPNDQQVVIDFNGVDHASYSFVDELVGKLVTMHADGVIAARVEIANASDVTRFHIEQCLSRRVGLALA